MNPPITRPKWHYGVPVLINFSSVLLSFAARILLARTIGASAFGVFAVWQNNVQLFGTIGTFGQPNYVLRELAHAGPPRSEGARRISLTAVALSLGFAGLLGVAGSLVFALLQNGSAGAAALQWLGTIAFAMLLTLSAIHRGLGAMIIGVLFDRLIYQVLFVIFLFAAAPLLFGSQAAMAAYVLMLVIAAGISISYLFHVVATRRFPPAIGRVVIAQARHVLPFFLVNCLFVLNARYMLSYAGIFVEGAVLGQVGLVFTIAAMMIIPTSTLNLVVAPYLAKRLGEPDARRVTLIYLCAVTALTSAGMLVVYVAHPFVFDLANVARTIEPRLVVLLSSAFGLTLVVNAGLLVQQFKGRAAEAAKVFAVIMTAKLIGGFVVGSSWGVEGLFWTDLFLGAILAAVLLSRVLTTNAIARPANLDPVL